MLRTILILFFLVSFSFGELVEETIEVDKNKTSLNGHKLDTLSIAISSNGKYLASNSEGNIIKVIDIKKKKEIYAINNNDTLSFVNLSFSPNGKFLISTSVYGILKIWDIESKKEFAILKGHRKYIISVAFTQDGKFLASASIDGVLKIWDIENKKEIYNLENIGYCETMAFNPNGEYLALSNNRGFKLLNVKNKKDIYTTYTSNEYSNYVSLLKFSPNGEYLVFCIGYQTMKLLDIEKQKEVYTFERGDNIYSVTFTSNGKYLAYHTNNTIKLWDVENRKEIYNFKAHNNFIMSVFFSPSNKYLASASVSNTIKLWDVENIKEIYNFKSHFHHFINTITFSSNGKLIAFKSNDNRINIHDIVQQKKISLFNNVNLDKNLTNFSLDGKYKAFILSDKTIKIFNIENSEEFFLLKTNNLVSSNSKYKTLIDNFTNIIKIIDNKTQKEVYNFKGNTNYLGSISFSNNEKYLAYSNDIKHTIKIIDIEKQKEIAILKGHRYFVKSTAFSPNEKYLISSSWDNTIKLWDIKKQKEIATLISRDDNWAWITDKYIKRKDDGTLIQKIKSQNGNFIELEPIYPNQPHDGNLTILKYPEKVIIYEGQTGKGEITIKNDSQGRLWWIDLLEENTSNCNLFAPERIQLLEANETKTLKFEFSAIRDYGFPKEENKTITLKLEAVKTKPIIIKVPIEIKNPMIKLQKVYLTDEKKGKILNIELQNVGGQDLNSSEIVTTLITKEANLTLDKIEKSLIKAGEKTKVTYPIDENLNLKNAKVKVLVRKNIYPIHTWELEREIKIVTSLLYYYIPLVILVLIIFYYIRVLTHPLTKRLSQNPKELNKLDFEEMVQIKKLSLRLYRLNTILSENEIDREVFEKSIKFYKTKSYSEKIKILTNRLLSESEALRENLFKINLTKEFILNITSINIMFIDKLNDDTQKELNSLTSTTLVITTNEIREKLLKEKKHLLIIPTSKEIARVLIFHDSLLAFSHLLSNYMKLSQISPYQISQGVRNSFMFFGRDKALTHILTRELTNYFLIGARQIGKSSFLREIERNYKDVSGIDCYYFTLHDENLLELLGTNLWVKNDLKLEEFIQKIRIYGKPILFLLDEVDKFIINETKSGFKILNSFRALSEEGKCFFVMAGYWELYKSIYLNYFSPIKNFGEVLHIEELEYEACFELATEPMKALGLSYENEKIVKEMIDMCGQRANLIAINCNLIIQNLDLKTKVITREMIKSAQKSQDFVSNLKFSENDKLAKAILYFTIELDSFNLGELVEILENEGIKFEIEALKEALNKLEIAFYLKKIENRYYYRVPLFIEYIRGDDLKVLKREIKRV